MSFDSTLLAALAYPLALMTLGSGPAGKPDARPPKYKPKTIELEGGLELEYIEQGEITGAPVVVLHGFTDSYRSFELVLPNLPTSLHVYSITQRGHGGSARPESGYGPSDMASDVREFLKAKGIPRAVVVGHSMGGYVASRLAIETPDAVSGLVLVGAFATLKGNAAVAELWDAVKELEDPVPYEFALEFQKSTIARPIPPEQLEAFTQESLRVPARVWKAALRGLLDGDHVARLKSIMAPTLIIWGDLDGIILREHQSVLNSSIAGSRLVVYERTGHTPHWEEPERFARDLAEFVEGVVMGRTEGRPDFAA